jgi:hypothetical protein
VDRAALDTLGAAATSTDPAVSGIVNGVKGAVKEAMEAAFRGEGDVGAVTSVCGMAGGCGTDETALLRYGLNEDSGSVAYITPRPDLHEKAKLVRKLFNEVNDSVTKGVTMVLAVKGADSGTVTSAGNIAGGAQKLLHGIGMLTPGYPISAPTGGETPTEPYPSYVRAGAGAGTYPGGGARKTRSRKSRGSSRKSRNNHKNKTRKGNNRKYNRRTRRRS